MMPELHFPWLEYSILTPALGSLLVWWIGDLRSAHNWSIAVCAIALLFALGEWIDFSVLESYEAHDHVDEDVAHGFTQSTWDCFPGCC